MSHQTGIQANDDLKNNFSKCHEGKMRCMKIAIQNEQLCLSEQLPVSGTWEEDFDKYVPELIIENQPCFILLRLDTRNSLGFEWLLISWSPDDAPVRQKMLYASTKATLKQEFGTAHIKDEVHCTIEREATLRGYKKHMINRGAPAPLTEREEALKSLQAQEHQTNTARQSTLGGVAFPVADEAKQALRDMKSGSYNYLQFKIDLNGEQIHLSNSSNIGTSELAKQIPDKEARYHLYFFKHTHEGDMNSSLVFIYSMPGYSCSIKERMMYSSCKGPFLDTIQSLGLHIDKRLEIDDGNELTEDYLYDEIHPKVNLHKPAFAKPKGPPNRGAKRITKAQ